MDPIIQLDKPRALRLTSRALRLVEHRDRSGLLLGEMLITHTSAASAAWLLWACLIHDDEDFQRRREPSFSVDDVCDWLDEHWFKKGKCLKDLTPLFTATVIASGLFSQEPPGKASPETGSGSPGSGAVVSAPSVSEGGSSG